MYKRLVVMIMCGLTFLTGCAHQHVTRQAPPATQGADIRELAKRIGDKKWELSRGAVEEAAKLIAAQEAHADMAVFEPLVEPLFERANCGDIRRSEGIQAADALVRIGQPAVPTLLKKLKSKDEHDRWSAMRILGQIGEPKSLVLSAARSLLQDRGHESYFVRWQAIEVLGKLGKDAQDAVADLEADAEDDFEPNQVRVQLALMQIEGTSDKRIRAIAGHLKSEGETTARFAAEALGDMGAPSHIVLPELLVALHSDNGNTRIGAAFAIGRIRADDDKTIAALIDRLKNDPELFVREAAASSLGEIGPKAKAALPALREAAQSGPESDWWGWGDAIQRVGGGEAGSHAAASQPQPATQPHTAQGTPSR